MFKTEDKPKRNRETFSIGSETVNSPSTGTNSAVKGKNTIIGQNISIEGSIHGDENIIIEGSMKGEIELEKHNFLVASEGRFEGEIRAQSVNISGIVIGNVKTNGNVQLTKDADFIGDIRSKNFLMEKGAYFKGSIELNREPNRRDLHVKKTASVQVQPSQKDPGYKQD